MAKVEDITFKSVSSSILNSVADVLESSDFISRTIGMNNSYEDIMFIVQALGREPISLLGKNYAFIFDHVRRNYMQGTDIPSKNFDYCNKFTFYKEVPTVRFADPYNDPMNLLDRWKSSFPTLDTSIYNTTLHYSESDDQRTNNKVIDNKSDLDGGNPGVAHGSIESYQPNLPYCDMIGKTNSNFNHGKYETLVARFHTNIEASKAQNDPTQSANSSKYGQSHGRNLLKTSPSTENGYDNPYCRVWTYHHQYNQVKRQIRPLLGEGGNGISEEGLESLELVGNYDTVGFRTIDSKTFDIEGGSKRLDKHGVLNYQNGTVNIAPTAKIKDYFEGKQSDYDKGIIETKKCMFSIENLAWKDSKSRRDEYDAYGLSPEQKGPLGGRIMWFPPYNLKFSEDVNVDWNRNKFIGRGEDVYTYTNTERRGNLSFTLLIDHPSILDYWTGHERNGMKNQGNKLDKGDSGGVDNIYNQENTLLRFFAGCEILSAKPQEYKIREYKEIKPKEPKEEKKDTPPPPDNVEVKSKKIVAILYYPNNYTGKDDRDSEVNPIWYIMNGVGTQKYVTDNGTLADIPTVIDSEPSGGLNRGGYEVHQLGEMGGNLGGISQVLSPLNPNTRTIASTYASDGKTQYLTSSDGSKISVTYDSTSYDLAKIVGSKALPLSQASGKNLTGATHQWYRRRYYYRVDKEYENQEFSDPNSYIDRNSYGLNGRGYIELRKGENKETPNNQKEAELKEAVKKTASIFGIEQESDTYRLVSFTDLFVALENDDANNVLSIRGNSENVKLIRNVFSDKEKYSNIKVSFNGHASRQGYNKTNDKIARERALTLRKWMLSCPLTMGVESSESEPIRQAKKSSANVGGVDEELVKIWRSASVTIEYDEKSVENAATAESTKADSNGNIDVVKTEIKSKETSKSNYTTAYEWLHNSAEGKAILSSNPQLALKSATDLSFDDISKITGKNYTDPSSWNYSDSYLNKGVTVSEEKTVKRYDNEGEFFKTLSTDEPFLHHLISDKIKYFDPAFHSISPEGFNARLTFLHQCTRQGSTVGNADSSVANTAYNLAFGRPPVCVLRVGDFYYTKIIITSLSIQYEQPQWDMNPEGIGMMPMYADITMNFVFLGGSDLAGPIARLQNAVSFNYYANASVYDNRAEKVEYNPNGSGEEIKFKGYNYPNMYIGDGLMKDRIDTEGRLDGIERDEF